MTTYAPKNERQNSPAGRLGMILVGLYAWAATVTFGLTILDILYANLVPQAVAAFSEVSDLLLLISAATILTALVAIAMAWESSATRNCLLASLAVIILGLLAPAFLSPFLQGANPAIGSTIRIVLGGSVSILAYIGSYRFVMKGNRT